MGAWIELLAGRFDRLHAELGQDPGELLERQLHTLHERRIATACNDYAFVAELFGVFDEIFYAFVFVEFNVFDERFARLETA